MSNLTTSVLHQLDQKIIYPHYDFKHLTEKYFEIVMGIDDFLIQLVKYCTCLMCPCIFSHSALFLYRSWNNLSIIFWFLRYIPTCSLLPISYRNLSLSSIGA